MNQLVIRIFLLASGCWQPPEVEAGLYTQGDFRTATAESKFKPNNIKSFRSHFTTSSKSHVGRQGSLHFLFRSYWSEFYKNRFLDVIFEDYMTLFLLFHTIFGLKQGYRVYGCDHSGVIERRKNVAKKIICHTYSLQDWYYMYNFRICGIHLFYFYKSVIRCILSICSI